MSDSEQRNTGEGDKFPGAQEVPTTPSPPLETPPASPPETAPGTVPEAAGPEFEVENGDADDDLSDFEDFDDFDDEDDEDDEDEFDDPQDDLDEFDRALLASDDVRWRWTAVLATIGAGLVAVATVQVLGNLIEGLSINTGERIRTSQFPTVADDLLHRVGYPFFQSAIPALIILLIGVVLLALPWVLGRLRTNTQDTIATIALWLAAVMALLLGIGATLAVRASLHEYSVKGVPVPRWQRWNYSNYLLVSLGLAALTTYGALSGALQQRRRR